MRHFAAAEGERMARWTLLAVGVTLAVSAFLSGHRLILGNLKLQALELETIAQWLATDLGMVRRELEEVAPTLAAAAVPPDSVAARLSPASSSWVDSVDFRALSRDMPQAADPMFAAVAKGRTVADLRSRGGRLWMDVFTPRSEGRGVAVLSARLRLSQTAAEALKQNGLSAVIAVGRSAAEAGGAERALSDWQVPSAAWHRLVAFEKVLALDLPLRGGHRLAALAPWKDFDAWDVVGAVVVFAPPGPAFSGAPLSPSGLILFLATILVVMLLATRRLLRLGARQTAARGEFAATVVAGLLLPMVLLAAVDGVWVKGTSSRLHQRLSSWEERVAAEPGAPKMPEVSDHAVLSRQAERQRAAQTEKTAVWVAVLWAAALAALAVAVFVARNLRQPTYLRKALLGYAFLGPSALHLLVFSLGPVLFALYVSFHNWGLIDPVRPFVGLGNYAQLLRDPDFWNSIKNTALYTLHVPVGMALSLGIALVMNQRIRGVHVLRTIFFLPSVTSFVAIAMIWQWIYNPDFGLLNWALSLVHLGPFPWLNDPATALLSLMLLAIWIQAGYQMVIFLAGLQGIPQYLYDAAIVDGASRWQRFRRITLPMLRPTTFFVLVTSVIGSFQVFTQVYVMTEGGPLKSTEVIVYSIYKNAWEYLRMGYASAMSWVLFAIVMLITLIQFRYLGKRVEYY